MIKLHPPAPKKGKIFPEAAFFACLQIIFVFPLYKSFKTCYYIIVAFLCANRLKFSMSKFIYI